MKRGEIWWAELPAPVGNRPVIILTRDAVLENIGSIVVALVTRTIRQLPTEVVLGRRQGLPVPCVANLDNILTAGWFLTQWVIPFLMRSAWQSTFPLRG